VTRLAIIVTYLAALLECDFSGSGKVTPLAYDRKSSDFDHL